MRALVSFRPLVVLVLCVPFAAGDAQTAESLPSGWSRVGPPEGRVLYEIRVDSAEKHGGAASLRIRFVADRAAPQGTVLSQSFRADAYRGRSVRLSGYVRSREATGMGRLWMRIDGSAAGTPFDNMSDRAITGSTDWRRYEIVLAVPGDATVIHIGAIFSGQGTLWLDDLAVSSVDSGVRQTGSLRDRVDRPAPRAELRSAPINLGFEDR